MTSFVILVRKDDHPGYVAQGTEEAHTAPQAIKSAYLKKPDGKIVSMVAVPARSWKPQTIRSEKVERIILIEGPDDIVL